MCNLYASACVWADSAKKGSAKESKGEIILIKQKFEKMKINACILCTHDDVDWKTTHTHNSNGCSVACS